MGEIKGVIKDTSSQPLPGVTVSLLNSEDSTLVARTLTDDHGVFHFMEQSTGIYLISAQAVNYEIIYSPIFNYNNSEEVVLPPIFLLQKVAVLNEITVKYQKPLIQQKGGKIIVNVAGSIISAGKSVWELLQSSPGVNVDNNNNEVSLQGKNGVGILIDGKPMYMSADQIVGILKNMNANEIESIEIITNPSSQYDAQGSAGIINIVTKRSMAKGDAGSFSGSYSQGYYPKYSFATNVSHRSKRVSIFGNLDYNNSVGFNDQNISRHLFNLLEDTLISINRQFIHKMMRSNYFDYKTGLELNFSDRSMLEILYNSAANHSRTNATNESLSFGPNKIFNGGSVADSKTKELWRNNILSASYNNEFDSLGQSIYVGLLYTSFNSHSDQSYSTNYFNHNNDVYANSRRNGELPLKINIMTGKVDYRLPFNKVTKILIGIKTSYAETNNSVEYDTLSSAAKWMRDSAISNLFVYNENINSAYLNFDKLFEHEWSVQIGIRGELTRSRGHQYTPDSTNDLNYFQLFPSVFIQKKFNKYHTVSLSFSRRIDRPNYQDLNPFRYYLDPNLYNIGNPFLRPQIGNSLETSYSFKNYFKASLNYSYIRDAMVQVLYQDSSSTAAFLKQSNLKNVKNLSLNIYAGISITNWLTTNTSVNLFKNSTEGVYQGMQIHRSLNSIQFNSTNVFKLPKNLWLEVTGLYTSKVLYGLLFMEKQYQLSFGIQKSLFKKQQGSIKLSVSDIFNNLTSGGEMHINNLINTEFMNHWDSRRAALTFTYRFNNGYNNARDKPFESNEQGRIKK